MHAASVHREPGSNSLISCILPAFAANISFRVDSCLLSLCVYCVKLPVWNLYSNSTNLVRVLRAGSIFSVEPLRRGFPSASLRIASTFPSFSSLFAFQGSIFELFVRTCYPHQGSFSIISYALPFVKTFLHFF